ncbi:MAG: hypothetical protein HC941_29875 [Microcoleus sp. SU_5_3]|nr:hypothetical protein [Microcoleus sp. SU_5_3]
MLLKSGHRFQKHHIATSIASNRVAIGYSISAARAIGVTPQITSRKKQSEKREALFAVRVNLPY